MPSYSDYAKAGGKLGEADYTAFSQRASAYLDTVTFGRSSISQPEAVAAKINLTIYALTDELYRQSCGGELASSSTDGYSETYVTSGKTPAQRLYAIVSMYLATTGLLYRGV